MELVQFASEYTIWYSLHLPTFRIPCQNARRVSSVCRVELDTGSINANERRISDTEDTRRRWSGERRCHGTLSFAYFFNTRWMRDVRFASFHCNNGPLVQGRCQAVATICRYHFRCGDHVGMCCRAFSSCILLAAHIVGKHVQSDVWSRCRCLLGSH